MAPAKELPKGQDDVVLVKKKPRRFKMIMFLCSLLLLITGIIGGGYWWLYLRPGAEGLSGLFGTSTTVSSSDEAGGVSGAASGGGASGGGASGTDKAKSAAGSDKKSESKADASLRPAIRPVPLPPLTVNLADPSGKRYLKIGMEVEVNSPDAVAEIEGQTARVRDAIILLLSSKRVDELASAEGKLLLKNEVAARLNQILGAQRVVRIYFTDFVIQ